MYKNVLAACLFLFCLIESKGNLKLYPLSLTLSSINQEYLQDNTIQLKLCFYNNSSKFKIPIYLSHPENSSEKTIYLRCFRLINNKTTNEQYEDKKITLDISKFNSEQKIIWLAPGDSLKITITLNDSLNYFNTVNAHHTFSKPILPNNVLQDSIYFNAFYDPSKVQEATKYFCYETSTEDECPSKLIPIPSGGCVSSYLLLKIKQNFCKMVNNRYAFFDSIAHSIDITRNTRNTCLPNCSFCAQVEKEDWKQIEKRIGNYIEGHSSDLVKNCSVIDWLISHKCVTYAYPVGVILASLPSYGSIGVGFYTKTGIQHMEGSIRFGTVYRVRSRVNQFFHLLGSRRGITHSSNAGTVTFLGLIPVDSCTKVQGYEFTIKSRMQWLQEQTGQKSLPVPERDYFTAHFGIAQTDLHDIDHYLEHSPEEYLSNCISSKDELGLCFLLPYPDIELQKKILNALVDMNSRKCLPYLITLNRKSTGDSVLDQQIAYSILRISTNQL